MVSTETARRMSVVSASAHEAQLLDVGGSTDDHASMQDCVDIAERSTRSICVLHPASELDGGRFSFNDRQVEILSSSGDIHTYCFDCVLPPKSPQERVYQEVARGRVLQALAGHSSAFIAFACSGSGKTFTITGGAKRFADRGLIPRSISNLFEALGARADRDEFQVAISFYEVYKDAVVDLLSERRRRVTMQKTADGPVLLGLLRQSASTESDAYHLLFQGDSNRHFDRFPQNAETSRGHVFFELHVTHVPTDREAVLSFIDLAAVISTRNHATTAIERSLEAFKAVVSAMQAGPEPPFDVSSLFDVSLLTQLMQPVLLPNDAAARPDITIISPLRLAEGEEEDESRKFLELAQQLHDALSSSTKASDNLPQRTSGVSRLDSQETLERARTCDSLATLEPPHDNITTSFQFGMAYPFNCEDIECNKGQGYAIVSRSSPSSSPAGGGRATISEDKVDAVNIDQPQISTDSHLMDFSTEAEKSVTIELDPRLNSVQQVPQLQQFAAVPRQTTDPDDYGPNTVGTYAAGPMVTSSLLTSVPMPPTPFVETVCRPSWTTEPAVDAAIGVSFDSSRPDLTWSKLYDGSAIMSGMLVNPPAGPAARAGPPLLSDCGQGGQSAYLSAFSTGSAPTPPVARTPPVAVATTPAAAMVPTPPALRPSSINTLGGSGSAFAQLSLKHVTAEPGKENTSTQVPFLPLEGLGCSASVSGVSDDLPVAIKQKLATAASFATTGASSTRSTPAVLRTCTPKRTLAAGSSLGTTTPPVIGAALGGQAQYRSPSATSEQRGRSPVARHVTSVSAESVIRISSAERIPSQVSTRAAQAGHAGPPRSTKRSASPMGCQLKSPVISRSPSPAISRNNASPIAYRSGSGSDSPLPARVYRYSAGEAAARPNVYANSRQVSALSSPSPLVTNGAGAPPLSGLASSKVPYIAPAAASVGASSSVGASKVASPQPTAPRAVSPQHPRAVSPQPSRQGSMLLGSTAAANAAPRSISPDQRAVAHPRSLSPDQRTVQHPRSLSPDQRIRVNSVGGSPRPGPGQAPQTRKLDGLLEAESACARSVQTDTSSTRVAEVLSTQKIASFFLSSPSTSSAADNSQSKRPRTPLKQLSPFPASLEVAPGPSQAGQKAMTSWMWNAAAPQQQPDRKSVV